MHGVKRSLAPSASARAARKEKEAEKLKIYLALEQRFFECRDAGKLDHEALEATTSLLSANPEYYTAWNYRRAVLSNLFTHESEPEEKDFFAAARVTTAPEKQTGTNTTSPAGNSVTDHANKARAKRRLIEEDLELTQSALRIHPKVYWIWNHRQWCLIEMPTEPKADVEAAGQTSIDDQIAQGEAKWKREMGLVNKMLELDPRNFHGWDYRRYLLAQIAEVSQVVYQQSQPGPTTQLGTPFPYSITAHGLASEVKEHHLRLAKAELAYTLRKIEANFSNFSAWHQRSKLLPNIWAAERKNEAEKRQARDSEFELLRQAIYTDPADQSVWLYHAWLVGLEPAQDVLEREIASIEELLEVEPDSKWCIESLCRYKKQLADLLAADEASRASTTPERLRLESKELLQRLMNVDPDRKGRWQDLLSSGGTSAQ